MRRFSPCDLSGAILRYSDFTGSQMKSVLFQNADLSFADFTDCDLREADFTGARLEGTIFEKAQLADAHFDKSPSSAFRIPTDKGETV